MLAQVFHVVSLSIYLFLGYYFQKYLKVPDGVQLNVPDPAKEPWQYLTIWNVIFQEIYFFLCVADDALMLTRPKALRELKGLVRKMRRYFFESVFFPTGVTVFFMFWPLFLANRQIIYPVELDLVVPLWMNHLIHTNIMVLIVLEVLLCPHFYSDRKEGLARSCVVPIAYTLCLLITNAVRGTWPYPLFGMIGHLGRALFFSFSYFLVWVAYLSGEKINGWLWERKLRRMKRPLSYILMDETYTKRKVKIDDPEDPEDPYVFSTEEEDTEELSEDWDSD